ncbi:hypothetical protein RJ641_002240 [Dillenia turbinata]|uniref:Uncharacterized protein n=1 Tax=Dillenia turbinata TaxID=194707 RepID=A0AAN8VMJ7_9MAGN
MMLDLLDDWVLCQVRKKIHLSEQIVEDYESIFGNTPAYHSQSSEIQGMIKKNKSNVVEHSECYFQRYPVDQQDGQSDEKGHQDMSFGGPSKLKISDGDFPSNGSIGSSFKDVLKSIKRTLYRGTGRRSCTSTKEKTSLYNHY